MGIQLTFEECDGYLLARAKGEWTTDAARKGLQDVASVARERGYTRILMDLLELSAAPTDFDKFRAGVTVAECFGGLKVAAVRPAELADDFAETTARNRGATVVTLTDFDEAVEWLVGGKKTESAGYLATKQESATTTR